MTGIIGDTKRIPGTYVKKRPDAVELANKYILQWDEKRLESIDKKRGVTFPPTICFSRKIGGGALEVADILAGKLGYSVVDREILEYIAGKAKLSQKTVGIFDERYPGKLAEFLSLAFGEKAFIKSDYTRHLFGAVFSIAGLGHTIFVGRGAHLLLPRDRVLAVRIICSKEHRVKKLAGILGVEEKEAEEKLEQIDKGQRAFFKRVYGRKNASPYEFDLVINRDYIRDVGCVAEIVVRAFMGKFGDEIEKTS
jgi:hypothetical protein